MLRQGVSHPTWVRGLKLFIINNFNYLPWVAPYVGAWIETFGEKRTATLNLVAPYVGAWIETFDMQEVDEFDDVAPYVGAWIET